MFSMKKIGISSFALIAFLLLFTPFDSDAHVNKGTETFSLGVVKEIPAGGYAAFRYLPEQNKFAEVPLAGNDALRPHAELVKKTLERVPAWLQYDLNQKLSELVNSAIKVKANANVMFEDVNGDSKPDLVVGDSEGKVHVYEYPLWIENKKVSKDLSLPTGPAEKTIDNMPVSSLGINIGKEESFAFGDVTGDGLKDIVVGQKDGFILFYRNTGLPGKPHFNVYCRDFVKMFDETGLGLATHPCASVDSGLVVGNKDGMIKSVLSNSAGLNFYDKRLDSAAPASFSSVDKKVQGLLVGNADGSLRFFKCDLATFALVSTYNEEPSVFSEINAGEYSVPAFGDIDGDKDLDLVTGNFAGELKVFKNLESETGKIAFVDDSANSPLSKIRTDKSASPALCDVNGDGLADLLLGAQNGTLKLFLSPEWKENAEALGEVDLGELSAPAFFDANNDGKQDVVAGNAQGALLYYENISTPSKLGWFEKFSMDLSGINDEKDQSGERNYYERYYPEREFLFGANDTDTLSDYCKLLQDCKPEFVDEIAFSIANLSSEVLRTISRMKESSVLLENARAIYDIAKETKYAAIKEHGDYTTLEYVIDSKTKKELDRDIYYWWVVSPRLNYEIPLKVDATWWNSLPDYYGMTKDEWLKFEPEPDIYALSAKAAYWRTFLPRDKSNGRTLLEAVKDSPTVRDAAENLHYWISCSSPDGFMTFGYLTSDSQPLVIHRKRYGSCGEQSIIAAACGRSMLIPTAVVTKRGEDHQWNEFYVDGKWFHWDICGWPSIDLPWDPEGRRHERGTCSTVTRWWGNDYMDEVTTTVANTVNDYTRIGSGYTDTADVTIKVLDAKGRPVDGALIVIRSHDGTYRRISVWGYTDANGRRTFHLGYKPDGGFTIEIVSPYGIAGTENFSVLEGRQYELTYNLKGEILNPAQAYMNNFATNEAAFKGNIPVALNVKTYKGFLYPPNYSASQVKKIKSEIIKGTDYIGVYKYPEPVQAAGAVRVLIMDKKNFESFTAFKPFAVLASCNISGPGSYPFLMPDEESYVVICNTDTQKIVKKLEFSLKTFFKVRLPEITYDTNPNIDIFAGQTAMVSGTASDNSGISRLSCSVNDSAEWADITNCYDVLTGKWKYEIDAGKGGPAFSGSYKYFFKAEDSAGNENIAGPVFVNVKPAREFKAQRIHQDDADNPLNRCSWILGPFRITGKERFIDISTDSRSAGFDMDMYLYMDKNRNGRLDGPGEELSKSASPYPKERIFMDFPEDNMYWLYCQGWEVDTPPAELDVKLSFEYTQRFIVNFSPVGMIKDSMPEIKAGFKTPFGVRTESVKVFLNGLDVTGICRVSENEIAYKSGVSFAEAVLNKVRVQAKDMAGNEDWAEWEFTVDATPPELETLDVPDNKEVAEKFPCRIRAMDNVVLAKVSYQIDAAGRVDLKKSESKDEKDKGVFTGDIAVLALPDGGHKLAVIAIDTAGNETKKECVFTVKNPPVCVASVSPADGSKSQDDRPVVRIYLASNKDINAKSIRMKFDGADVSERVRYSTKDNNKQAIYPLLRSLEKGRHEVEFSVEDVDGNKIDEYKFSFEVEVPGAK
ncbi:MAG: VCBS repeat-containing protein [Planctomycetes bacterium]|nr:VCBS repeat-containing protein [Planctomycetota bacterium]